MRNVAKHHLVDQLPIAVDEVLLSLADLRAVRRIKKKTHLDARAVRVQFLSGKYSRQQSENEPFEQNEVPKDHARGQNTQFNTRTSGKKRENQARSVHFAIRTCRAVDYSIIDYQVRFLTYHFSLPFASLRVSRFCPGSTARSSFHQRLPGQAGVNDIVPSPSYPAARAYRAKRAFSIPTVVDFRPILMLKLTENIVST